MTKAKKKIAALLALTLAVTSGSTAVVNADANFDPAGIYPVAEKGEVELEIFLPSSLVVEDFETNDFTKFLEDLTGISLDFRVADSVEWKQNLNMDLASGDYADIIMITLTDRNNAVDAATYGVGEGIYLQLDDYLTEENMPNYLAMMEKYDCLDATREADGHIYSLAQVNICYHCLYARKMWVNKRYLDEMGCEIPTTTEEFYDVCKKFLEYKPDGVAVAGATTGWFTDMKDWLIDAFVLMPSTSNTLNVLDTVALDKDTDEIVCVATDDRYKEALKWMKSLYDLGAIYEGDFTQGNDELKFLINQPDAPVLFFTSGGHINLIDPTENPDLYRDYVCMAPIEGPDGTRVAYKAANPGLITGSLAITDKCENPEAALKLLDYFYGEWGDLTSQYGTEEGVDWILDPEGMVGIDGGPAKYEILNLYSMDVQNHDWQDVWRAATDDFLLSRAFDADVDLYSSEGLEKMLYQVTKELYEPYGDTTDIVLLDDQKFTAEETSNISVTAVEIEKIIEESTVAFITGARDIDSEWDSYKESLDKAGLQDLLSAYRTAYARHTGAAEQ